jgi:hypothetical protein
LVLVKVPLILNPTVAEPACARIKPTVRDFKLADCMLDEKPSIELTLKDNGNRTKVLLFESKLPSIRYEPIDGEIKSKNCKD